MNCDALARWYRTLEYLGLGRALERRREEFLSSLRHDGTLLRVLLLGDGDGRFLASLLAANTHVVVEYVDGSAAMLALAKRRTIRLLGAEQTERRVKFHCVDALDWIPSTALIYDLVVTHFFLDCLTDSQVDELLTRLRPFFADDVNWIVSEFHQPDSGFGAWRARLWIGGLYRLFGFATGLRVQTLPDYRVKLKSHGFLLEKEVFASLGLLVSERWRRRGGGFCVDASGNEHLHSRTPKS